MMIIISQEQKQLQKHIYDSQIMAEVIFIIN